MIYDQLHKLDVLMEEVQQGGGQAALYPIETGNDGIWPVNLI